MAYFTEKERKNDFYYADRAERPDLDHAPEWATEYKQVVCVGNNEARFATVKKTVAYIVIDEDANGEPVVEKWNIKQLNW